MTVGGSFTTDGNVLTTLAAAFDAQADVLLAAVAPFETAAVAGMAEAWGTMGEEGRESYLEGAREVAPLLGTFALVLRLCAIALRTSAQDTAATEQGNAEMFKTVATRTEGGS